MRYSEAILQSPAIRSSNPVINRKCIRYPQKFDYKDTRVVFSDTGLFWTPQGQIFSILASSVIYSATLHLLRLSALSCIDVVVPSEVQLLLLVIRRCAQRKDEKSAEKKTSVDVEICVGADLFKVLSTICCNLICVGISVIFLTRTESLKTFTKLGHFHEIS